MKETRQIRAHLRQNDKREIVAYLPLRRGKDAPEITHNFATGRTYVVGREVQARKFKNISDFEGWAYRYIAEHDIPEKTL